MANGTELAVAYVSIVAETKQLKKQIDSAFNEAESASRRSGQKIGQNLNTSIGNGLGGSKNAAAKAGADAAQAYERALQSSIRGEKIGNAVGTVIGKGIGLGIKAGIGVAAAGATAAVGLLATSLTKGFTRLKNIDNAKFKLEALGHSASDVKTIMDSALKSVKGTAFGLDSAANTAATAVAAGVPTGQSLTDYLSNVADAAAIAQTSLDDMGSIFNKVQTNGKAMTDDLQMLADRGLPIFTWLQKQYGVTGEALQKMVSDGKVSAADFQRAVHDNIAGSAQKMGQSFDGAVQNLDAALGRLGATLLGVPFENASGGIGTLTTALDNLNNWVSAHQAQIVDFWTALGKAVVWAAQSTLQGASDIIEAVAGLAGGIGNVLGAVNKFEAWQADIRGDHDTANELRTQAEEFFSWGEGLQKVSDNLAEAAQNAGSFYGKLDTWAAKTKAAAQVADALGDSFIKINDNGQIIVESNAMEKVEELNNLGIVVRNLPDGSFEVVPGTPAAQAALDAFVSKNSTLPPATVPVDVDITAAKQKLQNLYNEVFHAPAGYTPPTTTPGSVGEMLVPAGADGYVPYNPEDWKRPRFGGGRAHGGPIGGPGPKGKDNTLIMAAPGEHMLTADEVDALGGQSGAYALRAAIRAGAIPGFSNGGAIKQGGVPWIDQEIGATDKDRRGTSPDPNRGNNPNQKGLPDWSEGGKWGDPPPGWFDKPIDPDDYLFPEWWPPGMRDIWKHPYDRSKIKPFAVPGFENGGAIPAIDYAYQNSGQPYQYGAFDCSMFMSQIYARMAGLPPGRYFTTDSDFEALGFKRGFKPGALNVGTNGGSGTNGHMAGTLPNGINVENAGSAGSMYGAGAKGANDFSQQWYYEPPNSGDMGDMQQHGMSAGLPPGPVGAGGQPVQGSDGAALPTDSGRTEGYIPAGAGNTSVAGTSFVSGLYNMGAEAINGLIDQAASAAATAASAAATAGSFGAGGQAAGPAAAFAIGLGANAAKRGVSYGFQMAGIGTDALIEQLTPFGAPRWLSTDVTAFLPQGAAMPAATTTGEQMEQQAAGAQPTAAGQQPVGQQPPPMPHQGNGAPPGPGAPTPALPAGPPPGPQAASQPVTPEQTDWWRNIFSFDQGGVLEPGMVGKNFSSRPEYVFTEDQMAELTPAMGRNAPLVGTLQALDMDEAMSKLSKVQRREAMTHQGRP
ncbi:tape measure protein [Mycobacterium phage RitSun]|nr:tape measure protein [Mycobacterium phage RitSun]